MEPGNSPAATVCMNIPEMSAGLVDLTSKAEIHVHNIKFTQQKHDRIKYHQKINSCWLHQCANGQCTLHVS